MGSAPRSCFFLLQVEAGKRKHVVSRQRKKDREQRIIKNKNKNNIERPKSKQKWN